MRSLATLLTLADSRLPTGGHVHSGGVEEAVTSGLLTDVATVLERANTHGATTVTEPTPFYGETTLGRFLDRDILQALDLFFLGLRA